MWAINYPVDPDEREIKERHCEQVMWAINYPVDPDEREIKKDIVNKLCEQ